MPVRHRELGDEIAPEPKRCRHCDESSSECGGGGGSEGSDGRASWRVTLDHDLVETLSAIYPEWFKPQHRRERSRAASPTSPRTPRTPCTPPSDDTFSSSGAEEMAGRQAGSSGASEPPSSPRLSPPKVIVDDSPLQPAMGKHKESLKVKLMMRRPLNQLVAQGIMPPLKTPPAYFEQCKQLERAKTGDLLKAKIQRRPDRQELERRHILEQESHVDPSLAEKQRMLKKARLADQLNDQLSHRPGPLELIKKNILHTEQDIETAVKSGELAFRATCEGASHRPEHPVAYCGPPEDASPSPSPPAPLALSPAPLIVSSHQHAAPGKTKVSKKNKSKPHHQPKARFKFHEYKGPPNAQKASSPPDDSETPYDLLLQQQQLLLQLMLPASPAPSSASESEYAGGAAPTPAPPAARIEDMKVTDLRAECKRRNLRVSGPKPQLIDRLRPFLVLDREREEPPRSPASVASVASNASLASPEPALKQEYEPPEDIVQSQRRQIEELERKLEASRQQLEAVRRDAAGAAASDQSRRLLQAHLYVSQLRAQLDALQQSAPPAPPPPPPPQRYVIAAAADAAPDRLVRLFTVTPGPASQTSAAESSVDSATHKTSNPPAYILNGVKVVPIAILPTTAHFEPERVAPPAPPPPPPPPPPMPEFSMPTPVRDSDEESQIMDDVLEILVENGELPPSAVQHGTPNATIDSGYSEADAFSPGDVLSPTDVLTDEVLAAGHVRDALAPDALQRELDDIQNEIMSHADMHATRAAEPAAETDLSVDLLAADDFHADFLPTNSVADNDDFFENFFSSNGDRVDDSPPMAMDIEPDKPMTPLPNDDILEHARTGFDYIDDLSLPSFQGDDSRHGFERTEFDLHDIVNETVSNTNNNNNMNVDSDAYEYNMETDMFPNIFGRGHVPQCDPLLGGVLSRPAPRPALKHYSWDKIEFDAT